jgi:hypothetical protein
LMQMYCRSSSRRIVHREVNALLHLEIPRFNRNRGSVCCTRWECLPTERLLASVSCSL